MRTILTFLILLGQPIVAASATSRDARTFILDLYRTYSGSDRVSPLDPAMLDRTFSPPLSALIRTDQTQKPGNVGRLDTDPVCDCQDPDGLKLLDVTVQTIGTGQAKAKVTFQLGMVIKAVRLRLLETGNGWRIDDVSSPDIHSLQDFLSAR